MNRYLITFKNTHDAIKGESLANKRKIKVKVMPTPTSITKSCGISIEVGEEEFNEIDALIKSEEMKVKGIFVVSNNEYLPKEV